VLAYNLLCPRARRLIRRLPHGWAGANTDTPVGYGRPDGQAILYKQKDESTVLKARLHSGRFSARALHGAPVVWFAEPYGE
jgi:hypothetical protein